MYFIDSLYQDLDLRISATLPKNNDPKTNVAREAKQTCEQYVWKKIAIESSKQMLSISLVVAKSDKT
jgi:hypothetical protein